MALPDLTDQFISDTYNGVLHTSNIPLNNANIQQIYDGVGNKSSFKLGPDGYGASFSGCLSADCYSIGNTRLIDYFYPVGSVIMSIDNNNPSTRFFGTTWVIISQGRFLAGVGTGIDKNGNSATLVSGSDTTTGEYNHKLTVEELPSHDHPLTHPDTGEQFYVANDNNFSDGASNTSRVDGPDDDRDGRYWSRIGNTGGDLSHNNIPPYFGVYIWRRTA